MIIAYSFLKKHLHYQQNSTNKENPQLLLLLPNLPKNLKTKDLAINVIQNGIKYLLVTTLCPPIGGSSNRSYRKDAIIHLKRT